MFILRKHAILSAVISICAIWMTGCSYDTLSEAFSEKFIPGAPKDVSAAASSSYSSSNSITVSWSVVNGAAGYNVYRSTNESNDYRQIGSTYYMSHSASYFTSYTDDGLSSGTTYYYRVSAYNNKGESSRSSSSNGVTTRPAAPSSVSATVQSSGASIAVSWYSVTGAAGYIVYRGTSAYGTYTQVGTTSSTSYTDSYPSPGTTYYYKVSAYNGSGESPQSSSYDYATTKPSAPSSVSARAAASNSITVNWYSATGATGYRVYRSTSASGTYTQVGSTSSTSYTDNSLTPGTTYYYTVSAYNAAGESSQSSYTYAMTILPPPSNVSATATSRGGINVSWSSVSGVTGYRVYRSTSAYGTYTQVETTSSASYTDNYLSPGTTYYYKVSAYNSSGESELSYSSNGATTVPAAPSNVYATLQPSSNSILVSWPSVTGAAGYRVYRATSAYGTYTQLGTSSSTSYTDNSLLLGTTYYYTVSAYNDAGESSQSSYNYVATVLPAPSNVSATVQSSGGYINVSWSSVTGATGYRVYRSTSSSGTYSQVGTTSSASYTDNSLTPGTTYYYMVSAYNSAGESSKSSYAYAATVLAAPSNVSAVLQSSGNSITVSWYSVTGATGYKVYRGTSAYGTYTQAGTASSTSYTDNYLTSGATYYYKVSAYNGSGDSELSSASVGVIVP